VSIAARSLFLQCRSATDGSRQYRAASALVALVYLGISLAEAAKCCLVLSQAGIRELSRLLACRLLSPKVDRL